jgi:transcriptional regulator with XRE-family HTH domain
MVQGLSTLIGCIILIEDKIKLTIASQYELPMAIVEYVGSRIRELRKSKELSQEALAQSIGTTANTVSRWETAVYRPTLDDLEKLSRFFGISILEFFPSDDEPTNIQLTALLSAAKQLSPDDVEELRSYAEYRRARSLHKQTGKGRGSRKGEKLE